MGVKVGKRIYGATITPGWIMDKKEIVRLVAGSDLEACQ